SAMSRQKLKTAPGSPVNRAGNLAGSGSRPTQTSVSAACQRLRSVSMKPMGRSWIRRPAPAKAPARGRGSGWRLLERLEAQALGTRVVAKAALLVFLVLAVVALEELHVRVALEGQDVGGDAVQEPAVMADHEGVARELQQRVFKRAQG